MARKITRIAIYVLIVAAVLSIAYVFYSVGDTEGEVYLSKVSITAVMNADGSLDVSERWDAVFKSGDKKRNLYKTFNLYDSYFPMVGSEITALSVHDNDVGIDYTFIPNPDNPELEGANSGEVNAYYIYGSGSNMEVGCYFPAIRKGSKSVTFNYTLTDAVSLHGDAAVLYWMPYSSDFSLKIKDFSCKIYLPDMREIGESDLALYHIETASAYYGMAANAIEYYASDIEAGTMVETRILLDTSYFDASAMGKVDEQKVRESIIREEKAWKDSWEAKIKLQDSVYLAGIVVLAVALMAGVAYAIYMLFVFVRYHADRYPPYVRDIPLGSSAAEMGYFFYYYDGGGNQKRNKGKLISATIMELARRGFIEIEASNADDKYRIKVFDMPKMRFTELRPHEKVIYDLLYSAGKAWGGAFTPKELEKYSSNHYVEVGNYINEFTRLAEARLKNGNNYNESKRDRLKMFAGGGLILIILSLIIYFGFPFFLFGAMGIFALGLSLLMFTPTNPRLNENGERSYAEAKALERYMLEFSNLKEYEIPALIVWEEYMVYATMMGISEKVIKELKARYPELNVTDDNFRYHHGSYLYTYMWIHSVGHFDFGAHLGQCISAVNGTVNMAKRQAAASEANKKFGGGSSGFGRGGGGFGGGGGGFGGGGGGAR